MPFLVLKDDLGVDNMVSLEKMVPHPPVWFGTNPLGRVIFGGEDNVGIDTTKQVMGGFGVSQRAWVAAIILMSNGDELIYLNEV